MTKSEEFVLPLDAETHKKMMGAYDILKSISSSFPSFEEFCKDMMTVGKDVLLKEALNMSLAELVKRGVSLGEEDD